MRPLAIAIAAALGIACASPAPTFPAPRLTGTLVDGDAPVVGAAVLLCFVSADGSCRQREHTARTDEKGAFTFERGSWGKVGAYQVLGPSWRLSVADTDQVRILVVAPLIGDPLDTHVEAHCDLSAEPVDTCQVVWVGGP